MDVLEEVTAAGHDELVTALLRVAAGVEFYRQVNGPRDVNLILKSSTGILTLLIKVIKDL